MIAELIIHDATPSMGSPAPEEITIRKVPFLGDPEGLTKLDRPAEQVWEWLKRSPVWGRLAAGLPHLGAAQLDGAGHARGWDCGELALALGLPVVVAFDVPTVFVSARQSWDHMRTTVAVNEDGTRGAVIRSVVLTGGDDSGDCIAAGIAYRAGGGVPDVD